MGGGADVTKEGWVNKKKGSALGSLFKSTTKRYCKLRSSGVLDCYDKEEGGKLLTSVRIAEVSLSSEAKPWVHIKGYNDVKSKDTYLRIQVQGNAEVPGDTEEWHEKIQALIDQLGPSLIGISSLNSIEDTSKTTASTAEIEEEEAGDKDDAEAEEKVFDIPLTRKLILDHKVELEKDMRSDEDIREAVLEWLTDPDAAEKRYGHISDWDVSRVTDMSRLFHEDYDEYREFDEDLSKWDTSNVTNMKSMFNDNRLFNRDLSMWDTSKVTDMSEMFFGASSFTSDLSKWQTGSVTDMHRMFSNASAFTSDLSKWQTGNVTNMTGLFYWASSFTSDLSQWQTGNVTNMSWMFYLARSFTSDLSKWQTGNVTDMMSMFNGATSFDCDLSQWQTGNVQDMMSMFTSAKSLSEKPLWYGNWINANK